ncbi:cAMP-dependent protein kinase type II regulatory chain [Trypanosoma conorhini]|uniref:cAMP-dependent protein kinase type II regulatory chain n=1 Tax=Trypanosoma conorhini TaxID=83891 RepID=A0A3S5ITU0_9TRYP|nr:cAMP-dependent protein kinase type II regulatory chain [Trypanosoma conorhini]RNF23402.1 cAMP-dependent protein kinase type II regulatory chain [Trypanosoma conorhini]
MSSPGGASPQAPKRAAAAVGDDVAFVFPEGGGYDDDCACTDAEDVLDDQASQQTLAKYAASVHAARRGALTALPFDESEAPNCAPDAAAATAADAAILRDVFASHPLLRLLDAAARAALMRATVREEVAPGGLVAPPLEMNTSFVIVTHGSVYATPNEAAERISAMEQLLQSAAPASPSEGCERHAEGSRSSAGDASKVAGGPHLPGETFFPVNLLYATRPSHVLRAGDDGATICRLYMQSFKCLLSKPRTPPQDAAATPANDAGLPGPQGDAAAGASVSTREASQHAQMDFYVFPVDGDAPGPALELPRAPQEELDAEGTQELCRRAREKKRRPAVVGESVWRNDVFCPSLREKPAEERVMLHQMVRRLPLFASLPEQYVEFIVDAFERRVFPPGASITAADGGLSHEFHWVERGRVVCGAGPTRATQNGGGPEAAPTCSSQCSHADTNGGGNGVRGETLAWQAGDIVSPHRLLFMYNDNVDAAPARYAAAEESGEVVLWTLRRVVLKRILMTATLREQQRLLSIVDGVGLFGALSSVERLRLTDALVPTAYAPGSCLLRVGSTPDGVFLIDTGTVEAQRATGGGTVAHVRFLGRKSCVGAMEVFTVSRSPFDYVAYSHVSGYRLRCEDMARLLPHSALLRIANGWCVGEGARQGEELRSLERLRQEQRDAASDSGSEEGYTDDMCPVALKTAEDDAFLHRFFTNATAFREASSMQRGLAVAAFEPKRELPCGCVLYAEDPTVASEARRRQCMYVIADGAVTLSHGGEIIATYRRGQAVSVTPLLQKRRATPATTATVASPTCSLYQLDRKPFRCLLMTAYLRHLRSSRALLSTAPLASRLGDAALTAISDCAVARVFMPGEVVLACGAEARQVELLLEGTVDVALWRDSAEDTRLRVVAALGPTDVVGGLDLLRNCPSRVCYLATARVRTLSVPAEVFRDTCLRSPAVLEYMRELQRSGRYAFCQREAG